MRVIVIAFLALAAIPQALRSQIPPQPSSPEAERALLHYRLGWESVRAEAWPQAIREFEQAIDFNKKFKLAYYGLGRAYMGLRQFKDAARAYETCRTLYQAQASENFGNSLDADRIRQD